METASTSAVWLYEAQTQSKTRCLKDKKEAITYSLKGKHAPHSEEYYQDVALFTDRVLSEGAVSLLPLLKPFKNSLQANEIEALRSDEEYVLELLTLGVLWMSYAPHVKHFSPFVSRVFHTLIDLRKRGGRLKPKIDAIRGILATLFLMPAKLSASAFLEYTPKNFSRLLNWLSVTGEFKEEVKRFQNWQQFFESISPQEQAEYLKAAHSFARWFASRSRGALGKYTRNVSSFLADEHPRRYRWREDLIFCGRREVEYHVIMVGAEIMNRAFQQEFQQTPKKAVLLPTCMRAKAAEQCQAHVDGLDIRCTGCTPDCHIHQLDKLGKQSGFDVFMIPHSSDFTKWLERWRNTREVGVVGVACVLNLFTGGYEMKDLNIPAQCILLDRCGCKQHWHPEGIPTTLDRNQLLRLMQ